MVKNQAEHDRRFASRFFLIVTIALILVGIFIWPLLIIAAVTGYLTYKFEKSANDKAKKRRTR